MRRRDLLTAIAGGLGAIAAAPIAAAWPTPKPTPTATPIPYTAMEILEVSAIREPQLLAKVESSPGVATLPSDMREVILRFQAEPTIARQMNRRLDLRGMQLPLDWGHR